MSSLAWKHVDHDKHCTVTAWNDKIIIVQWMLLVWSENCRIELCLSTWRTEPPTIMRIFGLNSCHISFGALKNWRVHPKLSHTQWSTYCNWWLATIMLPMALCIIAKSNRFSTTPFSAFNFWAVCLASTQETKPEGRVIRMTPLKV